MHVWDFTPMMITPYKARNCFNALLAKLLRDGADPCDLVGRCHDFDLVRAMHSLAILIGHDQFHIASTIGNLVASPGREVNLLYVDVRLKLLNTSTDYKNAPEFHKAVQLAVEAGTYPENVRENYQKKSKQ